MKILFTIVFAIIFGQTQGIPNGQPEKGLPEKTCGEEYLKVEYFPNGYIDKHYWVDCEYKEWHNYYGWYSWDHDDTIEVRYGQYWTYKIKKITELY